MADTSYPTQWRKPSFFGSRTRQNLIYAGLAIYLVWSVFDLNVDMQRVLAGFPRALDIFVRMMPPDFSRWELLVSGMIESIQMAIAATVLGVLLSIPLGICAASNLVPRPVYMAARGFIVVGRTFHEIIIAIFFVKLFGFGAVAGLLTLAFSSMTFLGKMLSEDIENIKHGPVEAIRAVGGNQFQVMYYGILPQIMPVVLGTIIFEWDINIRRAAVMGIIEKRPKKGPARKAWKALEKAPADAPAQPEAGTLCASSQARETPRLCACYRDGDRIGPVRLSELPRR